MQKFIFIDTAEGISNSIRPYWSEAVSDRANVVQAVPHMLEVVPPGTSKGNGVRMLLDHFGISAKEVQYFKILHRIIFTAFTYLSQINY